MIHVGHQDTTFSENIKIENYNIMVASDYIKSLNEDNIIFQLQEDTEISYLVYYKNYSTGNGKIKVPSGVKFAAYGPMYRDVLYIRLVDNNETILKRITEQEKANSPIMAFILDGFSFYITEQEVKEFNITFVAGSIVQILDIFNLPRDEYNKKYEKQSEKKSIIKTERKANDSFMPHLLGLHSFFNSTPLKGTKYIDLLPSEYIPKFDLHFYSPSGVYTIKDVASECEWLILNELRINKNEYYEAIKNSYRKAVDEGVYEAANNLGILAYNYEDSPEDCYRLLNYAISMGSQNAMINMFTLLWVEEKYQEGIAFLVNIYDKQNPSLRCLYNLAYLYFMGNDCPHNTLAQNVDLAKQILYTISQCNDSNICETEKGIPQLAREFLSFINESKNIYSFKAKEFHELLSSSVTKSSGKNKSEVFRSLSSIRLSSGYELGLRLAQFGGSGDVSSFYIYDNAGNVDKDIIKYLHSDSSAMGAWQTYLLMTSSTVMPVYWHGGYNVRKFIYEKNDVHKIKALKGKDLSDLVEQKILLPDVQIKKVSGISDTSSKMLQESVQFEADIFCCYWNEWEGLVREHSKVLINDSKVENYSFIDKFVIYPYKCDILF